MNMSSISVFTFSILELLEIRKTDLKKIEEYKTTIERLFKNLT